MTTELFDAVLAAKIRSVPLTPRMTILRGGTETIVFPCDRGCRSPLCAELEDEVAERVLGARRGPMPPQAWRHWVLAGRGHGAGAVEVLS